MREGKGLLKQPPVWHAVTHAVTQPPRECLYIHTCTCSCVQANVCAHGHHHLCAELHVCMCAPCG